jgi:hypothetical protein
MRPEYSLSRGRRSAGRAAARTTIASALLAASITLTLAAVSPAGARAQTADTIRACYVPASGTIYRVKAPGVASGCLAPAHVEFSWTTGTGGVGTAAKGGGNGGGGSTTDHGSLAGLTDDDHSQYLLTDGVRQAVDGFAVTGVMGSGTLPVTGSGVRMMWYPRKAAFRAGEAHQTYWDDANVGLWSVAMGRQVAAVGHASVALGQDANAWGAMSFATSGGTASGQLSRAMGVNARASNREATAIGYVADASGEYSTAIGTGAKASGLNAIAFGQSTEASADEAVALGNRSAARAWRSMAVGFVARATAPNAVAIGSSEASGERSTSMGTSASTNGKTGAFVYGDASGFETLKASAENQFAVRAQRIWFGTNSSPTATPNRYIETSTGAYLSTGGAWVSASDSTTKHLWRDVDAETVLSKLAAMPIRTWTYRTEDDSVRHLGPTAQEFRAAFGLGDTERAIASVDADGVALVAVQALEQRTSELDARLAALETLAAQIVALRAELEELRASRDQARQ